MLRRNGTKPVMLRCSNASLTHARVGVSSLDLGRSPDRWSGLFRQGVGVPVVASSRERVQPVAGPRWRSSSMATRSKA